MSPLLGLLEKRPNSLRTPKGVDPLQIRDQKQKVLEAAYIEESRRVEQTREIQRLYKGNLREKKSFRSLEGPREVYALNLVRRLHASLRLASTFR
jgi:hypothetical protein